MIKGEPGNTSQFYANAEMNFSVEPPSDVGGLERNPITRCVSTNTKVVKSYQVMKSNLIHHMLILHWLEFDGLSASNFEVFKISTLFELNASDLQNIGSTVLLV